MRVFRKFKKDSIPAILFKFPANAVSFAFVVMLFIQLSAQMLFPRREYVGLRSNFEKTFGEGASVEIEVIKVEKNKVKSSPKKEVRKYKISSKGQIANLSLTVITSLYVSHKISENIAVHPAFNNALLVET